MSTFPTQIQKINEKIKEEEREIQRLCKKIQEEIKRIEEDMKNRMKDRGSPNPRDEDEESDG